MPFRRDHGLRRLAPLLWGTALFALVMTVSACEDSVDPIIESEQRFSLYATLDMNRDTQYVRVVPIRDVVFTENRELDVQVRSVDLTHETTVVWRDSTITFRDGSVGHVYWAPLRLQPTHQYRLEVVENDVAVTTAVTTVPPFPVAEVEPEVVETIFTTNLIGRQRVLWHDLEKPPYKVEHWYRFLDFGVYRFVDVPLADNLRRVRIAEDHPDAYEVNLNLIADKVVLDTLVNLRSVAIAGMGMTITVLDRQFEPPGGTFDRDRLSQPGTMSNVEGGFGFVGSVGRFSVEWTLADTSVGLLKYIPVTGFARPADPPAAPPLPGQVRRAGHPDRPGVGSYSVIVKTCSTAKADPAQPWSTAWTAQ